MTKSQTFHLCAQVCFVIGQVRDNPGVKTCYIFSVSLPRARVLLLFNDVSVLLFYFFRTSLTGSHSE